MKIKSPSVDCDFILRYVEYHEFYSQRPDKIKHIDYIKNKIFIDKEVYVRALDKLHYFTAFPKPEYRAKSLRDKLSEKFHYYRSIFEKIKDLHKTSGIKVLVIRIFSKLK